MSQSSALFKVESKIYAKNCHKSSLPKIKPPQNSKNKFFTPSPVKIAFKNVRKLGRNHQLASNFTCKYARVENDEKKIINDHYEHVSKLCRVFSKEIPKTDEKYLITACTLNIEYESDIKYTELKGMYMWALNKNLKYFSQTRKVAFFKSNPYNHPNEIYSTISKNHTQYIKSMHKICYGDSKIIGDLEKEKPYTERKPKKMSEIMIKRKHSQYYTHYKTSYSKNKLPSAFLENSLYGTLPIRKKKFDINQESFSKDKKTFSEQNIDSPNPYTNNSYLRTFINGSHLKRYPSNKKIESKELKGFTPYAANIGETTNNEKSSYKKQRNFRRNRFYKILLEYNEIYYNINPILNTPNESNHYVRTKEQYALLFTFQLITPYKKASSEIHYNHFYERKSHYYYNRSIYKINNSLLRNIDNYMDSYQTHSTILPSKIQFIVDSLGHPLSNAQNGYSKSTHKIGDGLGWLGDDEFFFEEPKKTIGGYKSKGCLQNKSKKQKVGCKN